MFTLHNDKLKIKFLIIWVVKHFSIKYVKITLMESISMQSIRRFVIFEALQNILEQLKVNDAQ